MPRPARKYTLDTNVFIRSFRTAAANQALQQFHRAFAPFEHLSAIVAHELWAGAPDTTARRMLERHLIAPFTKRARVFAPSIEAWQLAGDVLADIHREEGVALRRLSRAFGNDVLLAVSCREAGITLVTENTKDFARIGRYVRFDFEPWPMTV